MRMSMSLPVSFAPSRARSHASLICRTACLNTSRPAIFTYEVRSWSTSALNGTAAPPAGRRALEPHRARTVAEQHARRAVLPIRDGAHLLGADDECRLDRTRV